MDFVDNKISSKKIVVFSKTYCPYCTKAKNVLKKYNLDDMEFIELDELVNSDQIQDYLLKLTGARTVPRVFVNGVCIGGGDDTVILDKNGKLKDLLDVDKTVN